MLARMVGALPRQAANVTGTQHSIRTSMASMMMEAIATRKRNATAYGKSKVESSHVLENWVRLPLALLAQPLAPRASRTNPKGASVTIASPPGVLHLTDHNHR